MIKNKGLGKGVGVLFGNGDDEELYFECNISNITANQHQPRTHFDDADLEELASSISEHGILQPLVVRQKSDDGNYELIAGERRLRAAKLVGLPTVPVIVRDIENNEILLELALIENIQRKDLNPIEEAEAYHKLIVSFKYTQEEAAKKLGKSRSSIANILRLLNLPDFIKDDLVSGTLTEGHARALLRVEEESAVKEIRDQIIKKRLSVRQTESLVRKVIVKKPQHQVAVRAQRQSELPASYCNALATQMTNRLNTGVSITQNGPRGKIEIDYYSTDDLERVIGLVMGDQ